MYRFPEWQLPPLFFPWEIPRTEGVWQATYSLWGRRKSDTTLNNRQQHRTPDGTVDENPPIAAGNTSLICIPEYSTCLEATKPVQYNPEPMLWSLCSGNRRSTVPNLWTTAATRESLRAATTKTYHSQINNKILKVYINLSKHTRYIWKHSTLMKFILKDLTNEYLISEVMNNFYSLFFILCTYYNQLLHTQ